MSESLIIGIITGTFVSIGYRIYKKSVTPNFIVSQVVVFILLVIYGCLYPCKAHAWCDNCKPIPNRLSNGVVELYRFQGQEAERLILEIKALTDEYAYNGNDAFMASVGAAMSALPSGTDPRIIAVTVILANVAVYFCKTTQCHWKTVYLLRELDCDLLYFKLLGDTLVHNRFMCHDCFNRYFEINYMGNSRQYFNLYPPCAYDIDGCEYDESEF